MDFTYKLDRKLFQPMITNMDWLEESELRKYQVALKADAALVHATAYPTSIAEAYQRANSYQLGHSRVTTGTVVDNTKPYSPAIRRAIQATGRIKIDERQSRMQSGSR